MYSTQRPGSLEGLWAAHRCNAIIMSLILVNAVLLGVEIDVSATFGQDDVPSYFWVINMVLVTIFLLESLGFERHPGDTFEDVLMELKRLPKGLKGRLKGFQACFRVARNSLKLLASGCHEFWRGEEWKWNSFDFCIVWLSVLVPWTAMRIGSRLRM